MRIYRQLYTKRTFWGIAKMKIRGWRIGFGFGFLEIGSGMSGLWLPRKNLGR